MYCISKFNNIELYLSINKSLWVSIYIRIHGVFWILSWSHIAPPILGEVTSIVPPLDQQGTPATYKLHRVEKFAYHFWGVNFENAIFGEGWTDLGEVHVRRQEESPDESLGWYGITFFLLHLSFYHYLIIHNLYINVLWLEVLNIYYHLKTNDIH